MGHNGNDLDNATRQTTAKTPADIDAYDAEKQIDLEKADNSKNNSSSASPCPSENGEGERAVLSFALDDPLNPYNWKRSKKLFVVVTCMCLVMNSKSETPIDGVYSKLNHLHCMVANQKMMCMGYALSRTHQFRHNR